MKQINQKIVGFDVQKISEQKPATAPTQPLISAQAANQSDILARDEVLTGKTYKIKPGGTDHAFYITINDIVDANGKRRPFEMFLISKHVESFQWISGMARVISAIFRYCPDASFLAKELKEVFDPNGGYFIPGSGGKRANSIVAHIGMILDRHLQECGIGVDEGQVELARMAQAMLEEKEANREEALQAQSTPTKPVSEPRKGRKCNTCGEHSVVRMDGCDICTSCGSSRCS